VGLSENILAKFFSQIDAVVLERENWNAQNIKTNVTFFGCKEMVEGLNKHF